MSAARRGTPASDELQQFVLQRALARIFADNPRDWLLKGGQGLLTRFSGARASADLDLVRISGGLDHDVMFADYEHALQRDLGDHLTFQLESRGRIISVPGVKTEHTVLFEGRELMRLGADITAHSHQDWAPPDVLAFPEHILRTGHPDELPDLRVISLRDVLATKVGAMFALDPVTGIANRAQDLVDTLLLALHTPWEGPATHAMLHAELAVRQEQGENHGVPGHFELPNPEWGPKFARYAAATPSLPYMNLSDALPMAKAFLDPLLAPEPPRADWDPQTLRWVPHDAPLEPLPRIHVADTAAIRPMEARGHAPASDVLADPEMIQRWEAMAGPDGVERQIALLKARSDLPAAEKVVAVREGLLREVAVEPSAVPDLDAKNLRFYAHQSGELFIHGSALILNPDTTIEVGYHVDQTYLGYQREAYATHQVYLGERPEGMTADQANAVALWRAVKGKPAVAADPRELVDDLIDMHAQPLRDALAMRTRLIDDYGIDPSRIRITSGGTHAEDASYGQTRWQRAHIFTMARLREDPVGARGQYADALRRSADDGPARAVAARLYAAEDDPSAPDKYALVWVRDSRSAPTANRNGLDTPPEVLRQIIDTVRQAHPDRKVVLVGDDIFARRPGLREAWQAEGVTNGVDTETLVKFWDPAKNGGRLVHPRRPGPLLPHADAGTRHHPDRHRERSAGDPVCAGRAHGLPGEPGLRPEQGQPVGPHLAAVAIRAVRAGAGSARQPGLRLRRPAGARLPRLRRGTAPGAADGAAGAVRP